MGKLIGILILVCIVASISLHVVRSLTPGLCGPQFIRNGVPNMRVIENCSIILGNLQMALMDRGTDSDWSKIKFPKLMEITQNLMIHRVHGLRSLRNIFPNLSVIRGYETAFDYALIIYENSDMIEIGLPSLTTINRGHVRIQRNDKMCYKRSVNWTAITQGREDLVDEDIYPCENDVEKFCKQCASHQCWNEMDCQKFEKDYKFCDQSCLGGCGKPYSPKHCHACKEFNDYGTCVSKCPPDRFTYDNYYCLTADDCYDLHHIPFNNTCIDKCPNNYRRVGGSEGYCVPCRDDDVCSPVCNQSHFMTDMATIRAVKGCKVINGSIELRFIFTEKTIWELYKNFGEIHTITGALKISRCNLESLDFLPKLRIIGGEKLFQNNSLMIYDNPNLDQLFNVTNPIEIRKGRIFFHYNPKLCLDKIDKILPYALEKTNFTTLGVSRTTNGDKVLCGHTHIHSHVFNINATSAMIQWEHFRPPPSHMVVGYEVHYSLAMLWDGFGRYHIPEVCQNPKWSRVIVIPEIAATKNLTYLINDLKPHTEYTYYVSSLVQEIDDSQADSVRDYLGKTEILHFRTLADQPSRVEQVLARALSDTEIEVEWQEPLEKNGELTHYIIQASVLDAQNHSIYQRNYCDSPLDETLRQQELYEIQKAVKSIDYEMEIELCKITGACGPKSLYPALILGINSSFFYSLSNIRKRDTITKLSDFNSTIQYFHTGEYKTMFEIVPASQNNFVIRNLRPYYWYVIAVSACNRGLSGIEFCSTAELAPSRSLPRAGADDIKELQLYYNFFTQTYNLYWEEPLEPNLVLVSYMLQTFLITDLNGKNYSEELFDICITWKDHQKNNFIHTLDYLPFGTYQFRVQAVSIGQNGNWTSPVSVNITLLWYRYSVLLFLAIILAILAAVGYTWHHVYKYLHQKYSPAFRSTLLPEMPRKPITLHRRCVMLKEHIQDTSGGGMYWGNINKAPCFIQRSSKDKEREIDFFDDIHKHYNPRSFYLLEAFGFVSIGVPYLIVYEPVEYGFMNWYMKRCIRTLEIPPRKFLFQWAAEIADAMAYLHSLDIVHGDVATRSMLLTRNYVLKLTDAKVGAGVSPEQIEECPINHKTLPLRWAARELLSDPNPHRTKESDVWSYGVFLWEIADCARTFHPYYPLTSKECVESIVHGRTLDPPATLPAILVKVMKRCFTEKDQRPTFREINALNMAPLPSFAKLSFLFGCYVSERHKPEYVPIDVDPPGGGIPLQNLSRRRRAEEGVGLLSHAEGLAETDPIVYHDASIARRLFEISDADLEEWENLRVSTSLPIGFRVNDDSTDWHLMNY